MALTRLLTASAVATLLAAQALAQTAPAPATTQPQRPATTQVQPALPQRPATTPPAAQGQPAQPQRPATSQATPPAAGQAQGQRVNLNTASASELDSLPQIGAARAQAILAERAKGRFRDWADFERRMAGTAVNQTALNAIKDRVRF
jgi:DNA uptake protein ComE-like DNA-binding protein